MSDDKSASCLGAVLLVGGLILASIATDFSPWVWIVFVLVVVPLIVIIGGKDD